MDLFHGLYCSVRIEVLALASLLFWRVIRHDVCGCFNERVSVNIVCCGVLWFLKEHQVGLSLFNKSTNIFANHYQLS